MLIYVYFHSELIMEFQDRKLLNPLQLLLL